MLKTLRDNPKTSLVGLAILGLVVALLFGRLSSEQFMAALGLLTGGGLLAAKDAAKPDPRPSPELASGAGTKDSE